MFGNGACLSLAGLDVGPSNKLSHMSIHLTCVGLGSMSIKVAWPLIDRV